MRALVTKQQHEKKGGGMTSFGFVCEVCAGVSKFLWLRDGAKASHIKGESCHGGRADHVSALSIQGRS